MTRQQFLDTSRRLLTKMEFDHEEQTGLDQDHEMPFGAWLDEIRAAQENA
jgi:hypothetical protein